MKKLLLVKNDKIGDFVLMWPAFYLLKTALPDTSIEVFVSPVVADFARACPYIDNVIADTGDDTQLRQTINDANYDVVLVSSSELRIYNLVKNSGASYTLAPKHKWFQYLYKHRVNNLYEKHEGCWRGGCLLVEHFLKHHNIAIPALPKQYWDASENRHKWLQHYGHQAGEKLIFVHPGTGGSSGRVAESDYINLITQLHGQLNHPVRFILTYNGDELVLAQNIHQGLAQSDINIDIAKPLSSLTDFAESIVAADMFIAGSTGPLHLAGLHNVATVGFYAGRRSAPHIRWQTLSQAEKRFAFTPPVGRKTGRNMALIDFDKVATETAQYLNAQN
ncbi:glycosyltransferase family 9 protein [Shewanella sp. WXL01]|uniref:glycosyltransferase family 9 protein n=1 Tax=Shewanella sp. WXL01 TaxID=2709721 RepID=UPI001438278B|nr:glycosyltransferase family 9 protein [Shewanella sp. WXL01]NKF52048.1 glycosyltransferase family 9 protein [Shewanella sp. WXL01]